MILAWMMFLCLYEKMDIAMTSIANIKKKEKYDVYIGRSSRVNGHVPNVLSNPFEIGVDGDRDEVIRKHAYQFLINWRTDEKFRTKVLSLNGKKLGCFCSPDRCHGDNYIEFLNAFDVGGEQLAIDVMRKLSAGKETPIFFNDKSQRNSWLNNTYKCNVYGYPSLENAYFASKCKNKEDRLIFKECDPIDAAEISEAIEVRDEWLDCLDSGILFKDHVLETLNIFKYKNNQELKKNLLSTNGKGIIHYVDYGDKRPEKKDIIDELSANKDNKGNLISKVREILLNMELNPINRVVCSNNILTSSSEVIAHGCNLQGKLGSGVAKGLAYKYPEIIEPYKSGCDRNTFKLGDIIKVKCNDGTWIVHMATQTNYGFKRNEPYASPDAIRSAVTKLMDWCVKNNIRTVSMPPVGAGRGCLDSDVVYKIIEDAHDKYKDYVDLSIFDLSFNRVMDNSIKTGLLCT